MMTVAESGMPDLVARSASDGLSWLFAHDHRFVPCGNQVYTHSQFEADLWPRYLAHCDRLSVIGRRAAAVASPEGLRLSSHENVTFHLLRDPGNPLRRFAAQREFRQEIASHVAQADGVIARLPSTLGLLALAEARRQGKPTAVEVAGCAWDGLWHYGSIAGKLYAPVYWWNMRRAVRASGRTIYVTDRFLQQRYPTGSSVQANASNVELPQSGPDVLARRLQRIGEREGKTLRLGIIATLRGRFKGIQVALQALADARDRLPDFTFLILGPGDPAPWRAMADRLGIGSQVTFAGTLPPGGPVLQWLDEIDIYLQPSLKEGLPRALIEAMSRGVPAIGARTAGIPELLPDRWIAAAGDHRGLADALITMASDAQTMREAARANFARAQDFTRARLEPRRAEFWSGFAQACRKA